MFAAALSTPALPAGASLSDRLASDIQGAQALKTRAASGDPEALRDAARQFEAMVVQNMLKTLRQTQLTGSGDPFADSQSLKLYQELMDQQWSQKIAASGGLGFADAMYQAMLRRQSAVAPEAAGRPGLPGERDNPGVPLRRGGEAVPLQRDTAAVPYQRPAPAGAVPFQRGGAVPEAGGDTPAGAVEEGGRGNAATDPRQAFLEKMRPHAEKAAEATGLPARFILAHAALESGWGRSEIADAEGNASHNLFGIKAGRNWQGEVAEQATTEYQRGEAVRRVEPFRAYDDYEAGFRDYAALLKQRYPAAAQATDAEGFAGGLARGGYATDPNYASKLIGVINSPALREVRA